MKVTGWVHGHNKRLKLNYRIAECFPIPHTLLPHQQGFSMLTVDYSQKTCKAQTLRCFMGNPKKTRETKTRTLEEIEKPLTPTARVNIKHSPASSQINIKPHTNDLFISVSIMLCIVSGFQQKRNDKAC